MSQENGISDDNVLYYINLQTNQIKKISNTLGFFDYK